MDIITPIYTVLIALVFVFLSVRTLRLRHRFSVGNATGSQPMLATARFSTRTGPGR